MPALSARVMPRHALVEPLEDMPCVRRRHSYYNMLLLFLKLPNCDVSERWPLSRTRSTLPGCLAILPVIYRSTDIPLHAVGRIIPAGLLVLVHVGMYVLAVHCLTGLAALLPI